MGAVPTSGLHRMIFFLGTLWVPFSISCAAQGLLCSKLLLLHGQLLPNIQTCVLLL